MTLYQEYLEFALDELALRHRGLEGDALDAALRSDVDACRQVLSEPGRDTGAAGAIAANASYDAALVALCRARGIGWDIADFARPAVARGGLEHSLRSERT